MSLGVVFLLLLTAALKQYNYSYIRSSVSPFVRHAFLAFLSNEPLEHKNPTVLNSGCFGWLAGMYVFRQAQVIFQFSKYLSCLPFPND